MKNHRNHESPGNNQIINKTWNSNDSKWNPGSEYTELKPLININHHEHHQKQEKLQNQTNHEYNDHHENQEKKQKTTDPWKCLEHEWNEITPEEQLKPCKPCIDHSKAWKGRLSNPCKPSWPIDTIGQGRIIDRDENHWKSTKSWKGAIRKRENTKT